MKRVYNLCLGLLVLGAGILSSCGKDEDPKLSKTEMIAGKTSKVYQITSMKVGGGEMIDIIFYETPCHKDNLYTFNVDKTYKISDGENKCDPPMSDVSGSWSLTADEKSIIQDGDTLPIKEITNTKVVVERHDDESGMTAVVTFTAKK